MIVRIERRSLASKLSLALLFAASWAGVAEAQTYGGRAFAAAFGQLNFADTGSLAALGGALAASENSIQSGMLSTGPCNSSCNGAGGTAQSSASVQSVVIARLLVSLLTCGAASAHTDASCAGLHASSTISSLVFAGVAVAVTGQVNQTVSVPGVGTLIINERVVTNASIRVNALHLILATGEDLKLCAARAPTIAPWACSRAPGAL